MAWLRTLAGLIRPASNLIEAFRPDMCSDPQRWHSDCAALSAQELASLQQLATGLRPRTDPTRWDSFIDGLNRVPRPLITLGVLAFLILAPLDPGRFSQIARAYQLMPDGFWALLSVIIAFYFGGRMQLKRQDMAIRGGALEVARELLDLQRAARGRDEAPPAPLPHADLHFKPAVRANRVIEAWKRQRRLAARRIKPRNHCR